MKVGEMFTLMRFSSISKCSNLIYTISGLIFEAILTRHCLHLRKLVDFQLVRREGEYKHIRLNDKSKAAKKKPEIV